jgi:hypothetical protein
MTSAVLAGNVELAPALFEVVVLKPQPNIIKQWHMQWEACFMMKQAAVRKLQDPDQLARQIAQLVKLMVDHTLSNVRFGIGDSNVAGELLVVLVRDLASSSSHALRSRLTSTLSEACASCSSKCMHSASTQALGAALRIAQESIQPALAAKHALSGRLQCVAANSQTSSAASTTKPAKPEKRRFDSI